MDISVVLKTIKGNFNVAVIESRVLIFFNAALAHIFFVAVDILIRIRFIIGYASVAEIAARDVTLFGRRAFNMAVAANRSRCGTAAGAEK